jgi:hypothetical protein
VAALRELEREAGAYESAARDYRDVITRIVQHHYEDRRRRVLAGLDAEISLEKKGLRDAREEAIRRLEAFVSAHSGAAAHPSSTPDAMFRLAALYEERARADTDTSEDLARGLRPAIALYKRILREFPGYRERAGVHYYLGHAYNDAGRALEAQQVWRALVCQNHFAYPTPPLAGDPEQDTVRPLPQDHDRAHWLGWRQQRPAPGGKDLTFENPYPEDCVPVPQQTPAGTEPRYLAEAWWLMGDHHFNEVDPAGGPFNLNRAESAYRRAVRFEKTAVHAVAMYKLAWTYFKQQRYDAAVRQFVELLRAADALEKRTGEPAADFRSEAFTYIAGSLTFVDFVGPDADAPFAARGDVPDTETDARAAERKMHVAVDRVQDARLVPQNERWTIDVYRALARELAELGQLHSMIEVDELVLQKWPLHRDAPVVADEIAGAYDRLASVERAGTAARAETAARALAARTRLSDYVGTTPWVQANLADHEAILAADRLAHRGLRRAAADHTNAGSALVQQADGLGEGSARDALLELALSEYQLAALAWSGPARDDDVGHDEGSSYEARYWLADAHHQVVALSVKLGRSPAPGEVDTARRAAVAVRDSNEDDRYLQPAAWMVVDLAQQVLEDRHQVFRRSGGREGVAPRDVLRTTGAGAEEHVVADPLPREVADTVSARDEYVARVPPARDVQQYAARYLTQAAETEFVYGQLDEARRRFTALLEAQCGQSTYGFTAWVKLLSIANLQRDVERARPLLEGARKRSCATTSEEKAREREMIDGTSTAIDFEGAAKVFSDARAMPEGSLRAARWRKAAALYRAALERAPAADAAPEAAMNGAYAYKQVGDYEQAIALYELFAREYGGEASLARLEKGDPATTPPKAPDPARYASRVGYLEKAYEGLSAAYVLFFDYRRAAATYDTVANNARFRLPVRRDAARNAAILHANLGDRERLAEARTRLLGLDPSPEQRAEVDFQVASVDLGAWDEHGRDDGPNRAARLSAIAAMDAFHSANKGNAAAAPYVVRAAYHAADLRRAGRDPHAAEWCKNTVAAFERLRAVAPIVEGRSSALGSPEADLAASCAYRLLDDSIRDDFDRHAGRYEGTLDRVKKSYEDDLARAETLAFKLQGIIEAFGSRAWSAAARTRQASLYDRCRTGLFFAREPALHLFNEREKRLLDAATGSNDPELLSRADDFRQNRRLLWRTARGRLLDDADRPTIRGYAEAALWARAWKVKSPAVDPAVQRLAYFTNLLGDARIRAYVSTLVDPETRRPFEYRDGLFLTTRPGLPLAPAARGLPEPLPALP